MLSSFIAKHWGGYIFSSFKHFLFSIFSLSVYSNRHTVSTALLFRLRFVVKDTCSSDTKEIHCMKYSRIGLCITFLLIILLISNKMW